MRRVYRIFHFLHTLAFLCLFSTASCGNNAPDTKSTPSAKVENAFKESELTTVTLSPQAEQRLGIETARVEKRQVARTVRLGGEIVAVPGRRIFVIAPMAGVVIAPTGSLPQAGMRVRKGQTIFRLLPLPAERDLLGTPKEVALKKMQLEVAAAKAKRAQQLLLDKAGSVKAQEEAEAQVQALGEWNGAVPRHAKPVAGPPLSDPHAASADLFFEMSNEDGQFRTGEKVSVMLAQKSAEENLTVPFSAILYDIHGGT